MVSESHRSRDASECLGGHVCPYGSLVLERDLPGQVLTAKVRLQLAPILGRVSRGTENRSLEPADWMAT